MRDTSVYAAFERFVVLSAKRNKGGPVPSSGVNAV
jgi:hypothetical protein